MTSDKCEYDDEDCYYDGGECLKCGDKSMCKLCNKNTWDTRCTNCDDGRICYDCSCMCEVCYYDYCIVCVGMISHFICEDCKAK